MKGLLGQPEYATGLLGAATANPNMARQFANARQSMAAPTSIMDERYPAWKKSQDQAEQFLLAADFISSAIPAAVMAAPYAKKGLLAAGKTLAPKVENYMARTGLLQPATVWHGSPHRFDKFDASKIGTGEGAQAYGHGLYFAESPDTAKFYARSTGRVKPEGAELNDIAKTVIDTVDFSAASKPLPEAIEQARRVFKTSGQTEALNWLNANASKLTKGENLYKVDLPDEAIAKMLDWDKPLSQQTEVMRQLEKSGLLDEALKAGGFSRSDITSGLFEGRHMLPAKPNAGGVDASQKLRQAGIPGIRYLDGGSRGTGAGTSNYVVFPGNESLLKILSRE